MLQSDVFVDPFPHWNKCSRPKIPSNKCITSLSQTTNILRTKLLAFINVHACVRACITGLGVRGGGWGMGEGGERGGREKGGGAHL